MLNAEKYKKEIEEMNGTVCVNKDTGEIDKCTANNFSQCDTCLFYNKNNIGVGCETKIIKWLCSEATETFNGFFKGDKYYVITERNIICDYIFTNCHIDKICIESGNAFCTKEEAEFEIEKRKVITALKRLSDWDGSDKPFGIKTKYCGREELHVQWLSTIGVGDICFQTRKSACDAINKVGEEQIQKYCFGGLK